MLRGVPKLVTYYDDFGFSFSSNRRDPSPKYDQLIRPKSKAWRHMLESTVLYESLWDLIEPSLITNGPDLTDWDFENHPFWFEYKNQQMYFHAFQIEKVFNISRWWQVYRSSIVNRLMILKHLTPLEIKTSHYGFCDYFGSLVFEGYDESY